MVILLLVRVVINNYRTGAESKCDINERDVLNSY